MTVLLFLLAALPHWDAVCYPKFDADVVVEMMFVPHAEFMAKTDSLPPELVDEALTYATRKAAERQGFTCGEMKRHDDDEHVKDSERWRVKSYEPGVGSFRLNVRTATIDTEDR